MILDERLRWMGFWMLDKMKGGKTREYYDQIRYAWKEGSSVEETEKRIQNLIKLIIMFLVDLWFTKWPILTLVEDSLKN